MNPFKGYWIVLKDIWIFSRTCQSFLDTKQPSCLNHHIFGNTITAFAKLVVFVLGFHNTVVSFILPRSSHTYFSFNHFLTVGHNSIIHTHTHTHHTQSPLCIHHSSFSRLHYQSHDCLNMKQPILICFIGVWYYCNNLDIVAYCIVS